MKRINKPELAEDLSVLFSPGDPVSLNPTTISDELLLTHSLLSGTHRFRQRQSDGTVGGAGAIGVQRPDVPEGFFDYLFGALLISDEAVAHNHMLQAVETTLGRGVGLASTKGTPRLINGQAIGLHTDRPFLLGPGMALLGLSDAIGVGNRLTLFTVFVRMRLLDPHPRL